MASVNPPGGAESVVFPWRWCGDWEIPHLRTGNGDDELGSVPYLARNADPAIVRVHQLLDDGQADPASSGVPDAGSRARTDRRRVRGPPGEMPLPESSTTMPGHAIMRRNGHLDGSTRRSELDGVGEEVGERPGATGSCRPEPPRAEDHGSRRALHLPAAR